jgi:hypothetical protein
MLHCGAAKANINPELPIHLCGYRSDLLSRKVHDDLYVAAIYLKNGKERLALLTYDVISLNAAAILEIRTRCAEATGIPAAAILTTSSHSHSTPLAWKTDGDDLLRTPKEWLGNMKKFVDRIVERSVKALKEAVATAEPAAVHYNTAHIRENLNRRAFFPSGQYFYQPKQKNLLPLCDGMADDELGVIFFKAAKAEKFIATLVNYTAHPLTVGDSSSEVTADYPGVLKREIETNLGGVALFVNGACGDNHPLGAEAGHGRCERMGMALAEKALYHRWDAVALSRTPIASEYREIVLPAMTRQQHENLPQNFSYKFRPPNKKVVADGGFKTHFSLWAVGPILFVGVPGELTAELGMWLKWESPFPKTFVMFLATDHLGYIPHRNAYTWGGYEVLVSPLAPNAGSILCTKILEAAEELKARMEKGGAPLHLPGATEGAVPKNAPGAAKK